MRQEKTALLLGILCAFSPLAKAQHYGTPSKVHPTYYYEEEFNQFRDQTFDFHSVSTDMTEAPSLADGFYTCASDLEPGTTTFETGWVMRRGGGKGDPGTPTVAPVGDAVLPLLLMAAAYGLATYFRTERRGKLKKYNIKKY